MALAARKVEITAAQGLWVGRFRALSVACEVIVETGDPWEARRVAERAADCAWRIEDKYSPGRPGSVIDEINNADGRTLTVDPETATLLDLAATLCELSDGLFDLTSGVLHRAWSLEQGDRVPSQAEIDAILPLVGWEKVEWRSPQLRLRPGMQLDFGAVAREYAVDRAAQLARNICGRAALINFGGDIAVSRPRAAGRPWQVGFGDGRMSTAGASTGLELRYGALATSGDTCRVARTDGTRHAQVLDPRSGWPVSGAPRSVTVAASSCTQAGMLTTLALLEGGNAERFLEAERVPHWIDRSQLPPVFENFAEKIQHRAP
jgi:thiamine biosynthesis lipoprotein